MKRPFAVLGIAYLMAQTVAVLSGFTVTAVLFFLMLLCALIVFIFAKQRPEWLLPVILVGAVCFGLNAGYTLIAVMPARSLEGQLVFVTGRVVEAPVESYGRHHYIIETSDVSAEFAPKEVRFRLSSSRDLNIKYNDVVNTAVQFNHSDRSKYVSRNLLASGVVLTAYLPYGYEPMVEKGEPTLYGKIIDLRSGFCTAARRQLGDELGGLVIAMFTGDTSGVDNLMLSDFRDCGLAHLFAVSGLHLSILSSALLLFLKTFISNYRVTSFIRIPFIIFFMAFSGFSMSIRRAGIMMLMACVADLVKREADSLNSLGLSALIICVTNHFAAADVGMLMSFASTAGLITLYDPVNKKVRAALRYNPTGRFSFILRPVLTTAITSVIASACTFPICVICFGEISLIGPIANVLCIYPASAFMVLGAVSAILYAIPVIGPIIALIPYVPAWFSGRLTIALTAMLSAVPGAGISVNYPFMPLLIGAMAVMLGIWGFIFHNERNRFKGLICCAALSLSLLILTVGAYNIANSFQRSIVVFSADSGMMTALVSGSRCVIIGTGGDEYSSWNASSQLAKWNISEAMAVVIPENTEYYAGNATEIIEQFEPEVVWASPEGSRYELIELSCERINAQIDNIEFAEYYDDRRDVGFNTITDRAGDRWLWCVCGELTMLIGPEGGDCMNLPAEYTAPDVALIPSADMVNITKLDSAAVIISARGEQGRKDSAVLEYRGVRNVFSTSEEGYFYITKDGQGIRIQEKN